MDKSTIDEPVQPDSSATNVDHGEDVESVPDELKTLFSLVSQSGFFDADWYSAQNRDVAESGIDPLRHYVLYGGSEGRPPSPCFDSASYLAHNTDVARAKVNPLVHHLETPQAHRRYFETVDDFTLSFGDDYTMFSRSFTALVAGSEIFNAAWFDARYPHIAASGINPVVYLLRYGLSERLDPGPDFDSGAYLDANPGVAQQGHNPVLHYLLYGRSEGLQSFVVQTAAADTSLASDGDLALISATPLFDEAWYINRYPDIARVGMDPAAHYLYHGGVEKRVPSLYFDPHFYLSQVPGLERRPINPLLHYLKFGRHAGFRPAPLADFAPPSLRIPDPTGRVGWSRTDRPQPGKDWTRYEAFTPDDQQALLFFGKTRLGIIGEKRVDVQPLIALSRLLNVATPSPVTIRVNGQTRQDDMKLSQFPVRDYRGFGPWLASGYAVLTDFWFLSDAQMALRFGTGSGATTPRPLLVRAFQTDLGAPCDPVFAGEGVIDTSGLSIIELSLENPVAPIVLCISELDGTLIELGLIPFPSLARGGYHYGELAAVSETGNPLSDYQIVSDALVREHLGWDEPAPAAFSISDICIDLQGAIGIEPIFSVNIREWLTRLFGIRLTSSLADDTGTSHLSNLLSTGPDLRTEVVRDSPLSRQEHLSLALPADALPTLSALVSRRLSQDRDASPRLGAYVLADSYSHRPRWCIVPAQAQTDLLSLQPSGAPIPFPVLHAANATLATETAAFETADLPLAVRYRLPSAPHEAVTLMPLAPDAPQAILKAHASQAEAILPTITAIVCENDRTPVSEVLEALSQQTLASSIHVILVSSRSNANGTDDLHRLFPFRHQTLSPSRDLKSTLADAAEMAASALVLILDGSIILHDERTVETLHGLIMAEKVASASCGLLRETVARRSNPLRTGSAGYFPSHISLMAAPRLVLSEPDAMDALPSATYPVLANNLNCALLKTDLLLQGCKRHAGINLDDRFALHFGLWALEQGYRNLCTTAVRATTLGEEPARETTDPIGSFFVRPANWQAILSSTTLLRDLR